MAYLVVPVQYENSDGSGVFHKFQLDVTSDVVLPKVFAPYLFIYKNSPDKQIRSIYCKKKRMQ